MKNSKKLLISLCLLVVAIFAATSTTFAWFALNNTADVAEFDMQITSGDDSLVIGVSEYYGTTAFANDATISAAEYQALSNGALKTSYTLDDESGNYTCTPGEDINADAYYALSAAEKAVYSVKSEGKQTKVVYYNQLTNDVLIRATEFVDAQASMTGTQLSTKLNHVTYDATTSKFYTTNENETDYSLVDNLIEATANVDYVTFTLYFKSTSSTAQDVYLLNSSAVTDTDITAKTVNAWKTISENEFGTHSSISQGSQISVNACNAARIAFTHTSGATTVIWDPNSTSGYTKNGDEGMAHDWLETFKNSEIVFGNGPTATSNLTVANTADIVGTSICPLTISGSDTFATGSTKVSIWVEGTDGECFNAIYGDAFKTKLDFICD